MPNLQAKKLMGPNSTMTKRYQQTSDGMMLRPGRQHPPVRKEMVRVAKGMMQSRMKPK